MEKEARKLYKKTRDAVNKARRTYVCRPLKDVIQQYRECKTVEEERALVKKESAHIRDLFREGDTAFRRRNVQKLMFFHMNGYPSDFGQIECLKLAASPKFSDKRVGYLGLLVLLDENAELLMLITNAVKMDLAPENDPVIIALALSVLGDISSPEMLRDLEPDITTLMASTDSNIAKRAILVADRAVRKIPELAEAFAPSLPDLLASGHAPSVYLAASALLVTVCQYAPDALDAVAESAREKCAECVMKLVVHTMEVARDPDVDVSLVPNPVLLVRLIRALRFVVNSSDAAAKALEILTRLAARFAESSEELQRSPKAVAIGAVSYETERSLRVLGVRFAASSLSEPAVRNQVLQVMRELLERFMSSKEQNVRYVGLQELRLSVRLLQGSSVQQHEKTILECLHHADVSMRSRTVDLIYAMCSVQPAQAPRYINELLEYLPRCDPASQPTLSLKITALVESLYHSGAGELEKLRALLAILRATDSRMPERLVSLLLAMLSRTSAACQREAVSWVCSEALAGSESLKTSPLRKHKLKQMRVAAYIVGEYGSLAGSVSVESLLEMLSDVLSAVGLDESDDPYAENAAWLGRGLHGESTAVRLNALLAVMKLATRGEGTPMSSSSSLAIQIAREILSRFRNHSDLETQQRACEYTTLLEDGNSAIRTQLFQRMPPLDYESRRSKLLADVASEMDIDSAENGAPSSGVPRADNGIVRTSTVGGQSDLLLLLDDDTSGGGNAFPPPLPLAATGTAAPMQEKAAAPSFGALPEFDLLSLAAPNPSTASSSSSQVNNASISALGGGASSADPLADLLGARGGSATVKTVAPPVLPSAANNDPLDLLGLTGSKQQAPPSGDLLGSSQQDERKKLSEIPVLSTADGVSAVLRLEKQAVELNEERTRGVFVFRNSSATPVDAFQLQLAVPKYIQLELMPASASRIAPGGTAEQSVSLTNSMKTQGKSTQLRFRLEYNLLGFPSRVEQGSLKNITG